MPHNNTNHTTAGDRILVTGASGFVGGRVVEALALSGFAQPVAAIRAANRAARVARFPVDLVKCDILDPADAHRATQNIQAVIHCAYTDDRASIVEGTHQLLKAATENGVRQFIFLSSAEVYGSHVNGTVDETYPTPKTGNEYADAKIEAEQVCCDFSQSLAITVLRPSLIYGPFSKSWSITIAKRLLSGHWRLFDQHADGLANLVYVDDLVTAIFAALQRTDTGGKVFNINGPDRITWNRYFALFNESLHLPPLQHQSASASRWRTFVMDQVATAAHVVTSRYKDRLMEIYLRGGWATRLMKQIKGSIETTPSGNELNNLFCRQAYYSDEKARHLLAYEPVFDITRGLEMTVAWLLHHELAETIRRNGASPHQGSPS